MRRRDRSKGFGPKPGAENRPPRRPADPPVEEPTYDGHRRIGAAGGWEFEGLVPDDADFDALHSSVMMGEASTAMRKWMAVGFYLGLSWGAHKFNGKVRTPGAPVYLLIQLERVRRKGKEVGYWRKVGTKILHTADKSRRCASHLPADPGEYGVLKVVGYSKQLVAVTTVGGESDSEWFEPDLPYIG